MDQNISGRNGPAALKCPQCGANLEPASEGYAICQYCGSSLIWQGGEGGAGAAEATVVRGMRLRQLTCSDDAGTGLEVFRMLAPLGWQFQGGCRWLLDNPGMPAVVAFQLWNPHGPEGFEVLPNMNFIWSNPSMAAAGSRHFGAEVRSPVNIREALRGYVLPRYRQAVSGLQILNEEPLPDLPRLVRSEAPDSGGWAEGGKVRIRYTWKEHTFDEEIFGVVEAFRTPIAGMFGTTTLIVWFIDYLFAFRAAAGRLDASQNLFSVMLRSFQLNPHWYAAFKTIARQLAQQQIQRIQHIGQIGQMLAQAGRELREQNLNDWYARQASYDRIATDWSRTIRDVDAFVDPHRQEVVELPAGYGNAWANNLGEYILSDDPNFNPNLASNLHWEPMSPQPK